MTWETEIGHYDYLFQDTPYSSEADLIKTVLANVELFLVKGTHYLYSTELPIGAGTVDIVVGVADVDHIVKRMSNEQLLNMEIVGREAVVLSNLYLKRKLRAESIARRTGLDIDIVRNILWKLTDLGLCLDAGYEAFLRAPLAQQITSLISIEGKLQRWDKALEQAHRNRLFSTYSYVVLDAKKARPAIKQIERFIACGVGLAVARSETQTVEIIYKPSAARPISNVFGLLAQEKLITHIVNCNATLPKELQDALHTKVYN